MASESGPYVPPVGFSLAYQGGHHDVYCNGAEHIWTSGGFTGLSERQFKRRGKCDCGYWKELFGEKK